MRPNLVAAAIRRAGGVEIRSDGLLHQDVDAGFEQCAAGLFVGHRRGGNHGRIHPARQFAHIGQGLGAI